jgi:hypothetical protein
MPTAKNQKNVQKSPEYPDDVEEKGKDLSDIQNDGTSRSEAPIEVDVPNMDLSEGFDLSVSRAPQKKSFFFYPAVICGRCEKCGTAKYVGGKTTRSIDKSSGQVKYRQSGGQWQEITACNCPHYKGLYDKGDKIQCHYCGETFTGLKSSSGQFAEKLGSRAVYVGAFSDNPKSLIMYCDAFDCREAHRKRVESAI